jgi:DNA repair protein RadC
MNIREIEVSVRYKKTHIKPKPKVIKKASDAVELARQMFNLDTMSYQEQLILMCLNSANHVIGYRVISTGSINASIIEPKMIFTIALQCCATSIILFHNHPSGNLEPSLEDIAVSKQVKEAGKIMEIRLLDHIIVTEDDFTSIAERQLL